MSLRVLVIDNYDSFVFNLVQYLAQLGADCQVRRNDILSPPDVDEYDAVLLSPGPGTPEAAGICVPVVRRAASRGQPLLGVCLGHQAIAVAFGARVARAPELLHGKTSLISHDGAGVFAGIPSPFTATRYHSLAVEPASVPADLVVTATTADGAVHDGVANGGVVMGLRHRHAPIEGVQFHPESVLTEHGHHLLANWLAAAGDPAALERLSRLPNQSLSPVEVGGAVAGSGGSGSRSAGLAG